MSTLMLNIFSVPLKADLFFHFLPENEKEQKNNPKNPVNPVNKIKKI
jgi:hypothetical protein